MLELVNIALNHNFTQKLLFIYYITSVKEIGNEWDTSACGLQ